MKKVSLVIVLLFVLAIVFVSAEKGDAEVGIGYSGIPFIYGSYEIKDRMEVESEIGYFALE